ncbi:hypothetical protein J6590_073313 [Homalodisca vitripennis]|nr:hypothetical protein J6590_073313 [Homalodisca vitripennis]
MEAIGGVWTLAPGALPRRFEAFARERDIQHSSHVTQPCFTVSRFTTSQLMFAF